MIARLICRILGHDRLELAASSVAAEVLAARMTR